MSLYHSHFSTLIAFPNNLKLILFFDNVHRDKSPSKSWQTHYSVVTFPKFPIELGLCLQVRRVKKAGSSSTIDVIYGSNKGKPLALPGPRANRWQQHLLQLHLMKRIIWYLFGKCTGIYKMKYCSAWRIYLVQRMSYVQSLSQVQNITTQIKWI